MSGEGRELYRSPNGDRWLLIRETLSDRVLVRHEPNRPSGGKVLVVEVGDFLSRGHGPEQQALLRLIGSLVEAEVDTTAAIKDLSDASNEILAHVPAAPETMAIVFDVDDIPPGSVYHHYRVPVIAWRIFARRSESVLAGISAEDDRHRLLVELPDGLFLDAAGHIHDSLPNAERSVLERVCYDVVS